MLQKLNEHGVHFAQIFKKRIAEFAGVRMVRGDNKVTALIAAARNLEVADRSRRSGLTRVPKGVVESCQLLGVKVKGADEQQEVWLQWHRRRLQ